MVVAGHALSPNAIEHGILRRSALTFALGYLNNPIPSRFERLHRVERLDPRVHFALNCGARSCPPFAAYEAQRLGAQLDAAARAYLASETTLDAGGESVRVPRLLLWYLGDFGGRPGILRQLHRYGVVDAGQSPRITFGAYDWTPAIDERLPGGALPVIGTAVEPPHPREAP